MYFDLCTLRAGSSAIDFTQLGHQKYFGNSWIPEGKLIWVEFIGVN